MWKMRRASNKQAERGVKGKEVNRDGHIINSYRNIPLMWSLANPRPTEAEKSVPRIGDIWMPLSQDEWSEQD